MEIIQPIPDSPQERFLKATVRELGFGGQAGGAKSFSLILDPLFQIHKEHFHAILFRRTYKQLMGDDGLIDLSHQVYPILGGQYSKGEYLWTFEGCPGTIRFAHLQHETDIKNHRGLQYAWIGFDELQDFTERQYLFLFSRNRCPNPDVDLYTRVTFNPGGIGHYWIKKRFIDSDITYKVRWFRRIRGQDVEVGPEDKKALPRMFIPSRLEDNPYLYQDGQGDYEIGLHQLEELDFRRLRYGDWDVRTEGRVYYRFQEANIISYDKLQSLLHSDDIVAHYHSHDFGGTNHIFLAIARDREANYYVYHTEQLPQGTTRERAEYVRGFFNGQVLRSGYGGSPGEKQIRKDYADAGLSIKLPQVTDVESQINSVNEMFRGGNLFISSELVELISQLDNCTRDEKGNIVDKSSWHYLDALRYFAAGIARRKILIGYA